MLQYRKYNFLIGITALSCLPFTFSKIVCWLTDVKGMAQFSEAVFLEEYFKLFGVLIIVLIGIQYSEFLIVKRIKKQKIKELNKCKGYFKLLNSKLMELKRLNHLSKKTEESVCFDEIDSLIEIISIFLHSRSHILSEMEETDMLRIIEIRRLKDNIKKDLNNRSFLNSYIEKMIVNSKNLSESHVYKIECL